MGAHYEYVYLQISSDMNWIKLDFLHISYAVSNGCFCKFPTTSQLKRFDMVAFPVSISCWLHGSWPLPHTPCTWSAQGGSWRPFGIWVQTPRSAARKSDGVVDRWRTSSTLLWISSNECSIGLESGLNVAKSIVKMLWLAGDFCGPG